MNPTSWAVTARDNDILTAAAGQDYKRQYRTHSHNKFIVWASNFYCFLTQAGCKVHSTRYDNMPGNVQLEVLLKVRHGWSATLFQTDLWQHIFDGWPLDCLQIFMFPRGWILLTFPPAGVTFWVTCFISHWMCCHFPWEWIEIQLAIH